MSSVGTWFHKNRALAFGVMAAGSSLGGVIFPIMVDRLVDQLGFAWAMRISAFLILGLLVYANLTIKSRLRPTVRSWSIMEFVDPFRELPFVLVVVASFLFFFGMFLPFTFMILEAQYHGMSSDLAAYLISILNAGTSETGVTMWLKWEFVSNDLWKSVHFRSHHSGLHR
jgi:MFS family permease